MTATLSPLTTGELSALVREAVATSSPIAIHGALTWPAARARIADPATSISLSAMRGIVEYVPGDLTLTARAGTTLAEIDEATRPHGQWCPLFPWGTDAGTLGATFATATTGPFRRALGAPRDLALGVEFVDGTGAIIRGGGRVVKNVAGFDLTRLLVGAWGTLGIITEVSVRLRARPVVDATFAVACDPTDPSGRERLAAWASGPYAPLACELPAPPLAEALGLDSVTALIRIGGNAALVNESKRRLAEIGRISERDDTLWTRYRALDPYPRRFTDAFASPLAARVRAQFDPHGILNPGVLGEVTT